MQNTIIWDYEQNIEQLSQNPVPKWNPILLVLKKFIFLIILTTDYFID